MRFNFFVSAALNYITFRILYSNELYYCTQNRTVIGHFTTQQPLLYDFE
jgi:hypothetical protein